MNEDILEDILKELKRANRLKTLEILAEVAKAVINVKSNVEPAKDEEQNG